MEPASASPRLTIAIDFDGTFIADPVLWRMFIEQAHGRGHRCVCVTGRSDEGELTGEVRRAINGLVPVVFAGPNWKRDAARAAGFEVNVWIDDNPEYVACQALISDPAK